MRWHTSRRQALQQCIHAWFEEQGYRVAATPAGPDGGIDLILKRDGERFFVQCKHWRASRIGVAVVRELYGVMVAEGATGGFVVGVGVAVGVGVTANVVSTDSRVSGSVGL